MAQCVLAGNRMRRGQQLRGRERNGAAEQRLWGARHGEGVGSGSALAEVTRWHQQGDNAVTEGVGACEFANLRRHWLEKAGRLIRPRGDSTV